MYKRNPNPILLDVIAQTFIHNYYNSAAAIDDCCSMCLPNTCVCSPIVFKGGEATASGVGEGCASPDAEMAYRGRMMVTLHCIASSPGHS